MVETMIELAFRGPKEEALVKRIAKAGNITEVVTHINRMQKHVKKMTLTPRVPRVQTNTTQRKRKKKGTPREPNHTGEGGGGGTE
jgi:hypothetical protein